MEIYYWIPFFYQIDIIFKVFFFGLTKTSLTNFSIRQIISILPENQKYTDVFREHENETLA